MLRSHRAAAVDAHLQRDPGSGQVTRAQLVLAPLCIVAAGSAFAAELIVGTDATTFSALAVVPVLAASLLRSRALTLIVAAFSMFLQVGGVGAGMISRNAAGMQISVYVLTLAVAALQQSHSPLRALDGSALAAAPVPRLVEDPAEAPEPLQLDAGYPPPAIRVAGVAPLTTVGALDVEPLPHAVADRLTRRERDVVVLAVQGLTAREIGAHLFIGERTVETHLANAYGKLGVRSKVDLIRLVAASAEDHTDLRTRTEATRRATA